MTLRESCGSPVTFGTLRDWQRTRHVIFRHEPKFKTNTTYAGSLGAALDRNDRHFWNARDCIWTFPEARSVVG